MDCICSWYTQQQGIVIGGKIMRDNDGWLQAFSRSNMNALN